MSAKLAVWRRVVTETLKRWFTHDSMAQSAALSYYTAFSLAPVLLVVVTIAGVVFGKDAVRGRLVRQFEGLMGRDQAALVQTVLKGAERDDRGPIAAIAGVVMLIVGATAVFAQLQSALNRIWEVAPKKGHFVSDFLRKRMLSFALVLGIGFLLLVSLVLSAGLAAIQSHFESRFGTETVWLSSVNGAVTFALFTLLFAMIFRILPDAKIPWRDVWVGALGTALLFVIGKWAIGLYLGRAAVGSAYGAAGSVIVLLLWVYYVSMILLFGAEFTRAYSRRLEKHAVPPEKGAKKQPKGADVPT